MADDCGESVASTHTLEGLLVNPNHTPKKCNLCYGLSNEPSLLISSMDNDEFHGFHPWAAYRADKEGFLQPEDKPITYCQSSQKSLNHYEPNDN